MTPFFAERIARGLATKLDYENIGEPAGEVWICVYDKVQEDSWKVM